MTSGELDITSSHIVMDHTWEVPVPQSTMASSYAQPIPQSAMASGYAQYQQYPQAFTGYAQPVPQSAMASGYAQYQQYPQAFTGYNPYYMGYPWTMGQSASMYPCMPGSHQMSYHTKVEESYEPPTAKRAHIEIKADLSNLNNIDANLLKISKVSEVYESSSDLDFTQDTYLAGTNSTAAVPPTALTGPMKSMLANQPPPLKGPMKSTHYNPLRVEANSTAESAPQLNESTSLDTNYTLPVEANSTAETAPQLNESTSHATYSVEEYQQVYSPMSPIPQMNVSSSVMNDTYSTSEYKLAVLPIQEYSQDQPIAPQPFQASQVMVMLPDGTKSSLWDQKVPAAFAAYQQPDPFTATVPSRKHRAPRGKSKTKHCNLCNKTYESSYKLDIHMNTHTGERPFKCEYCDKGFKRGSDLNSHLRVHTQEKPYKCKFCKRGFSHSSDRIIHMVTQVCTRANRYIRKTGPSSWVCVGCETEEFKSQDQVERHVRQHETGKGLFCPVCNMNYHGQKASVLVKHVRECHPVYIESLKN